MTEESLLHDLGENKNKQWYQLYPDRLTEEIKLMRSAYPAFTLHHQEGENIYWLGKATAFKPDGSELYSLNVKVECSREYPIVFPQVFDSDSLLAKHKCPHLTINQGANSAICYGNRLDPQLDFLAATRVKNVVDYICVFLIRQWYFEHYGKWLDGQPHGVIPFLEHEVKNGPVDPNKLCPCGMTSKLYRNCHLPIVAKFLYEQDVKLKDDFKRIVPKIGRNDECPCGKKTKSKKCCFGKLNHSSSKFFLLMKYPKAFGLSEEVHKLLFTLFD
ncbi:MAG: hypothetical protein HY433_00245 [Candidatus Liptonbacteria bacterium]|nr:hypothetical protein [Candidatus Liptonbacteria bacterium]